MKYIPPKLVDTTLTDEQVEDFALDSSSPSVRFLSFPKSTRLALNDNTAGAVVLKIPLQDYMHIEFTLHARNWNGSAEVNYRIMLKVASNGVVVFKIFKIGRRANATANASFIHESLRTGTDTNNNKFCIVLGKTNEKAYWSVYYAKDWITYYSQFNSTAFSDGLELLRETDLSAYAPLLYASIEDLSNPIPYNKLYKAVNVNTNSLNNYSDEKVLSAKAIQKYIDSQPHYKQYHPTRMAKLSHTLDGHKYIHTPEETGCLVIKLPNGFNSSMFSMDVHWKSYKPGSSASSINQAKYGVLTIGGYLYNNGKIWHSTTIQPKMHSYMEPLRVRLGKDADDNPIIIIGETTDTWKYARIIIENLYLGYNNIQKTKWVTGWDISIQADLTPYTVQLDVADAMA